MLITYYSQVNIRKLLIISTHISNLFLATPSPFFYSLSPLEGSEKAENHNYTTGSLKTNQKLQKSPSTLAIILVSTTFPFVRQRLRLKHLFDIRLVVTLGKEDWHQGYTHSPSKQVSNRNSWEGYRAPRKNFPMSCRNRGCQKEHYFGIREKYCTTVMFLLENCITPSHHAMVMRLWKP